MTKMKNNIIGVLLLSLFAVVLSGCGTEEIVQAHIGDPVVASGELAYYVDMDEEERSRLCDEQHMEVSGEIKYLSSCVLYIGDKKQDGLVIHCNFNDTIENVSEGDYITLDGVCYGCYSDSMYLYGCRISEYTIIKEANNSGLREMPTAKSNNANIEALKSPISSYEYSGKKYDDVEKLFSEAGFDVNVCPAEQHDESAYYEYGDVVSIEIGGRTVFGKGEEITDRDDVTIYYYTIEKDIVENETESKNEGDFYVYIPQNGGRKFHSVDSCSGITNMVAVTITKATSDGYTPCKRCCSEEVIVAYEENEHITDDANEYYDLDDYLETYYEDDFSEGYVKESEESYSSATVGSDNTGSTSGGGTSNFNTYDNAEQQNTEDLWVLNTNRKKIHHPSCSSVKKISPDNYATSNESIESLESRGYTKCGNCF